MIHYHSTLRSLEVWQQAFKKYRRQSRTQHKYVCTLETMTVFYWRGREEEGGVPQPLPFLLHPSSAGQTLVSQSPETPLLSTNFTITSKHRVHTPLPRPLDRSGHFLLHLWTYSRYPAREEHSRRTEELAKEEDILGKEGEGRREEEKRGEEGRERKGERLITSISSVDCCLSHVKSRSTLTL